MKRIGKAGLLSLLALAVCGNVYALQLIYPLDGTYVTRSNYLIVKGGDDPLLSGLTIEINGVKSDIIDVTPEAYRDAFADMLIVEPSFDPGENKIIIEGYLGDERLDTVTATVFFHDQFDAAPPADFSREVFHSPAREDACVDCHNMNPTEQQLGSPDPRRNPCGSCHARMLNKAHVHGPAGVFECTYCHDAGSSPTRYQARPGDASLCVECHEEKVEEFRKSKVVHGPIEADLCMVCHDPHASNERAQLVMPVYDLCASCHEQVISEPHVTRGSAGNAHPLKGVVNPAGNGEDLSCASCHNPHAGQSENLFRWGMSSRFSLCAKCHNK